jgi:hypothetical protein
MEMRVLSDAGPQPREQSMKAPAVVLAVVSAALYLGAFLLVNLL